MHLIMKRLISTLALATMAGFALPALAAPTLVEKHQIPLPKMDAGILKSVSTREFTYSYQDFDRNYFTKKGKNLPVSAALIKDIDCQDTTYRLWTIGLDIPAASRRVGYLVSQVSGQVYVAESSKAGKSKWKLLEQKYTYPWTDMTCASGNSVLFAWLSSSGTYTGSKATYDTFSEASVWSTPRYPSLTFGYQEIMMDGVRQMPGSLTVYGTQAPYGDSRVLVLDGPSEGLHTLPWYRDLTAANLKSTESIRATFYRLSDGYGVTEILTPVYYCTVSPCTYPSPITTYYRIHDGESAYSIVPSLPKATLVNNARVSIHRSSINVYAPASTGIYDAYTIDLDIHGLTKEALNSRAYDYNRGNVAWENAKQMVVRYFVGTSASKLQYWQAVIQK